MTGRRWLAVAAGVLLVAGTVTGAVGLGSNRGAHRAGPTGVTVAAPPSSAAPTTSPPSVTSAPPTTGGPSPAATAARPRATTVPGQTTTALPPVAAGPACPPTACATVDATRTGGPFSHAGSGFDFVPSPYSPLFPTLHPTMYRSVPATNAAGLFDWSQWDAASATGTATSLILSDLWVEHFPGRPPATPWSDWSAYTSWVRTTVSQVVASGRRVSYWEVYSEPGWNNYYSPSDFATETPDDLLQQFLVTYQTIKSVDPGAAIIGPSIGKWTLQPLPPNNLTHEPDLTTFLQFCSSHDLQLAAVAWHDNGQTPAVIESDAAATWAVMRSLPGIGHPAMFLDEYGGPFTSAEPGWDVGYLEAVAASGMASAQRSCWDGCSMTTLDDLLTPSGQPTYQYYLDRTYSAMAGASATTSSTDPNLSLLGAVAGNSVTVLLGRHQACAGVCNGVWRAASTPAPPEPVRVDVVVPWVSSRVSVVLGCEPFATGAAPGPVPVQAAGLSVAADGPGREVVSFTIPAFADGSAYTLTVSPA